MQTIAVGKVSVLTENPQESLSHQSTHESVKNVWTTSGFFCGKNGLINPQHKISKYVSSSTKSRIPQHPFKYCELGGYGLTLCGKMVNHCLCKKLVYCISRTVSIRYGAVILTNEKSDDVVLKNRVKIFRWRIGSGQMLVVQGHKSTERWFLVRN